MIDHVTGLRGAVPTAGSQSRRSVSLTLAVIVGAGVAAAFFVGGIAVGTDGAMRPAAPVPVVSTVTVIRTVEAKPAAPAAPPQPAAPTIADGTWSVGVDFPAGTYRTQGAGGTCYWKISRSGSNGGDIINNHIGGGNLTVTLRIGQDFESARCGTWVKVG